MAYLETLKASGALVPAGGSVIANTWPAWEITTPQYPAPNPYALAQNGYRRNEVMFACVQKRANAIAEAPLCVYSEQPASRGAKKPAAREEQGQHKLRRLMQRPNDAMGEVEFWQAVQIYLDIAGFSIWEIELNRIDEPRNLWPLRPDWCSFLRGEHKPLRAVRYQPPGLAYEDIPIERCVVFMEFDPIYPMLKGLSRSAVAMRVASVDNAATDFLSLFFKNGAVVNGLLKTVQSLNAAEAKRIRDLWREQHGGVQNWIDPAVLGSGVEYQQMQMNFKDMAFDAIDGRDEARICQIFDVPPILVGSKIGLERATYANYKEARTAFYEETVTPRWRYLASEVSEQLLPHFEDTDETDYRGRYLGPLVTDFDLSKVRALQEDRDAKWKRADLAYKGGWASRDEARAEAELDPIDGDVPVFAADPKSTATGAEIEQEKAAAAEQQAAQLEAARAQAEQQQTTEQPEPPVDGANETDAEPVVEPDEKQVVKALAEWRKVELARVAGAKTYALPAFVHTLPSVLVRPMLAGLIDAKTASEVRAVFAKHWPKPAAKATLNERAVAALEQFNQLAQKVTA